MKKNCETCGEEYKRNPKYSKKQWADSRYCSRSCSPKKAVHGLTHHPLFSVWSSMIDRCRREKHPHYKDYGGRGISVHPIWLESFKSFFDWGMSNGWKKGLQIDRKDNNGDYGPDNCRFVTSQANNRNRRSNRLITYKGETKPLIEWAQQYGIGKTTLKERLNRGWSVDDALTKSKWSRVN